MKRLDVCAIGELNADLVMAGLNAIPQLGQEYLCRESALLLGGSTANCACAMASLGLKTGFVGALGEDAFGLACFATLERYGVDTAYIRRGAALRTGLTVCLSVGGDRAMATYLGDSIDSVAAEDIPDSVLDEARHVHIGSFFLSRKLAPGLPAWLRRAKAKGLTVSLDAGFQEEQDWDGGLSDVLPHVDLFFPNMEEARGIGGTGDIEEAAGRVHSMMGGGTLIVKLGADGALAVAEGGERLRQNAYGASVVDTTGAGDSFNAGFLYAWLGGRPLAECLCFGNAAGAISVGRMGGTSGCPTLGEVERCIRLGRAEA
ncbi:MAG: carbohydrate kinase family protein [Clostridiales bacterium]|nr:carbohydrate kinase family protein [Clostridiales bacterium]